MANNFSNWMERQLKDRGRADIDHESLKELYPFNIPFGEYPLIYPGINYLRLDWPRWIKGSGAVYDRLPNSGSTIPNRREREIHHILADGFYLEFKVIESYFREYYRNTGLFDREYFKGLVTDFRKHFPPDHREPDIKYFDDLINEFTAQYEPETEDPTLIPEDIALICVYNGEKVTRNNCIEIAKKYGYPGKGTKLYNHYGYYKKGTNRRAMPDKETATTLINKIERFRKIMPYINPDKISDLQHDISILESYL